MPGVTGLAWRSLLLLGAMLFFTGGARAQTAPTASATSAPVSMGPQAALNPAAPSAPPRPVVAGAPIRVQVRGGAEVRAVATADHGDLRIHGELIDDAGTPIPGAPIVVTATTTDDAHAPIKVGPLRACEESGGRGVPRGSGDELVIESDERGGFCAIGHATSTKLSLKLRFRGTRLYDAAESTVSVEAAEEHLLRTVLRFEPPPETIDLDRESVTVTASLRVDRSEASRVGPAGSAQRANLPLVLVDERGAHVADATTGGDGRARFEVKTTALAGPGNGELTVRFAGNAVLAKAEWSHPIVRRAEARLSLSHPIERGDAEEGIPIDVDVATSRGPVSGGVVEARRATPTGAGPAGDIVGAGDVDEKGHAHLVATFSAGGARVVPLQLRFIPAAPSWYRPGPELRVEANLQGPGVGRQILLAAVVIAAAAWVVGGWRRSPRPRVAPTLESAKAPPSGRAGVQVIDSPADLKGWRGTVSDAHDGTPVAGARLTIVAPAFEGDGVVARAVSDERGAFTLEGSYRSDARLVVDSAEHTKHEQALPPPAVLAVALVTRRRALLERLVRWARQKGAPFDGTPEPTPGHVRRVAARASSEDVEAWASRVEHAVYGPDAVDEAAERDVRAAEPRAAR
jgi:hypothetical protein